MVRYIVIEQRIDDGMVLRCCDVKNSYDSALGKLFRCILNKYNFKENKIEQEDPGKDNSTDIIDSFIIDDKIRFFILLFDSESVNYL